jgi:ribosomal protein S18 acetylase RimI-like enzyme
MLRLKPLSGANDTTRLNDELDYINQVRARYAWSQLTYTASNSACVLLIQWNMGICGYVQPELMHSDFSDSRSMYIFVHDLHIVPSHQRRGVGSAVFHSLLSKGVDLEFVVANVNQQVAGLYKRFNYRVKYQNPNTSTIRIARTPAAGPQGRLGTPGESGMSPPSRDCA